MDYQNLPTNVGEYLFTSSLGNIIETEKEIIKSDEKILFYTLLILK